MSKYRNKFCQSSSPGKGPSADQIWNASQKVGTPAYKYARAICEKVLNIHDLAEIDERIYMAAPKSKDSINRKARNNITVTAHALKTAQGLRCLPNLLMKQKKL